MVSVTEQVLVLTGTCRKARSEMRPQFVLFGDSITQYSFATKGWGAQLANHYQRKVDVVNRGYSGYNTAWAKAAMPKVLAAAIFQLSGPCLHRLPRLQVLGTWDAVVHLPAAALIEQSCHCHGARHMSCLHGSPWLRTECVCR